MQEVLIGDIMQSLLENLVSWHCHVSCNSNTLCMLYFADWERCPFQDDHHESIGAAQQVCQGEKRCKMVLDNGRSYKIRKDKTI